MGRRGSLLEFGAAPVVSTGPVRVGCEMRTRQQTSGTCSGSATPGTGPRQAPGSGLKTAGPAGRWRTGSSHTTILTPLTGSGPGAMDRPDRRPLRPSPAGPVREVVRVGPAAGAVASLCPCWRGIRSSSGRRGIDAPALTAGAAVSNPSES